MMKKHYKTFLAVGMATVGIAALTAAKESFRDKGYVQTNFVANKASYAAQQVDPALINAWGIATRPAGAGGHFWVLADDTSFEYVGDVQNAEDPKLQTLHQDDLQYVKVPTGGEDNVATGTVFVDSKDQFIITQNVEGVEPIHAPAKFIFASDGGIISAWTERKKSDGSFDRPHDSVVVIDASKKGSQFFGLAINAANNRIYAADFGVSPSIKVYDGAFKPINLIFDMPFDDNKNGKVDPGEYAPFNIQALRNKEGQNHLFVTYAKTQVCPQEEVEKGSCKSGELFVGEEDTSKPGQGHLVEYTEDGKLVAVWDDGGKLSAPWGLAFAPSNFGALSNTLLVSNFGDGTIAAYNPKTRTFQDVVRNNKGKSIKIDKIWGIVFGNGASLGDKNALYFAAGPNDEADGLFGSLRPAVQ